MPPFRYDPVRSPYVGSIGDMIAREGEIRARAALESGQAWAGATQNIGNTVVSTIQQQTDPKAQMARMALSNAQHEQAGQAAMADLMTPKVPQGPAEGGGNLPAANPFLKQEGDVSVWDTEGLSKAMAAKGYGDLTPKVVADIGSLNKAHRDEAQARQQFGQAQTNVMAKGAGTALAILRDHPNADPNMVVGFIGDQMVANGTFPPEKIAAVKAQLLSDPTQLLPRLEALSKAGTQAPVPLKKDEQLLNPNDLQGAPLASNIDPNEGGYTINGQRFKKDGTPVGKVVPREPAVATPTKPGTEEAFFEQYAREHNVDPSTLTIAQQADARAKWAASGKAPDTDEAPALTPEAIKLTARQFAMTGTLPPMGMGKAGAAVRTKIINAAADEYKGLDLPSQVAAYKANQSSLVAVTDTLNKVQAFESAAGKNLDQFLTLAAKVPDTGVPWLNAPIRSVNAQGLGSADQAAFNAARDVALREIARVTSDPKLSGVLSDSARKEVSSLSPDTATFAQIKAVAKTLKQDMSNVHSSLTEQQQAIQRLIASPPAGAGSIPAATATPQTAAPAAPAGWKYVPKPGGGWTAVEAK